jgi:hypothetical protein
VSFGASRDETATYVEWDDFTPLLPQNNAAPHPKAVAMAARAPNAAAPTPPMENVISLRITGGQVPVTDSQGAWLVRANSFTFEAETVWPLTELTLKGPNDTSTVVTAPKLTTFDKTAPKCARKEDSYFVGVRPMGINCTDSSLTLSMMYEDEKTLEDIDKKWDWTIAAKPVPDAMWGAPIAPGSTPKAEAKTLPGRMMGLSGIRPQKNPMTGPPPMPQSSLWSDPINPKATDNDMLPLPQDAQKTIPTTSDKSLGTIATTVTKTTVADNRTAIFNALGVVGLNAGTNGDMTPFVTAIPTSFAGEPMLGKVSI